ncbi:MAG: prepilin peptidase [Planctomycetes bacterium]|nr:prepilin peptidase [Planctomycetota bacterium]
MNLVATLWWLLFCTSVGLCVGSFLNVVIYRLPRDRSLRQPVWSACPACDHRIRWYDNFPVVSYVLLGGHCRDCGETISPRYLFIEAVTAIVMLLLLDAFFIEHVRLGLSDSVFGLTDQLASDWPILTAHFVMFAALLAMSAIDLEYYWVDIRFTNLVTACGFILHAIWTPKHSAAWFRPNDTLAVMSIFALAGLFVVWLWVICRPPPPESEGDPVSDDRPADEESRRAESPHEDVESDAPKSRMVSMAFAGIAVVLLLLTIGMLFIKEMKWQIPMYPIRVGLPLALLFVAIVRESSVARDSDVEIIEAIDEERHQARGMVLREFTFFIPAIVLAAFGFWLMREGSEARESIATALHRTVPMWDISFFRRWAPLEGISTAAAGYVLAGALGWAVRIVFTLVFGREAFATGDIHMMAAAGCVAGWPVVLLGFFVTCGVALAGWVLTLPFKRTRALPLGPWLFLSLLLVTLFYEPLIHCTLISRALVVINVLFFGNSQFSPII